MKPNRLALCASLLTGAALLTGCGSGSAGSASDGSAVTVGVLPLVDCAPVYWAQQHGYFKKEGLEVKVETLQGGPLGIQKVVTGQVQFSFGGAIPTVISTSKGAPVQTVDLNDALGPGQLGIFVTKSSPIRTLADLNKKTVGINTLDNVGDVSFANLAMSKGIESKPSWVEVPFPEMIDGIKNGSIQAGYLPEPFATAAKAAGLREVVDLVQGPNVKMPTSTVFTSTSYARSHAATVRKFVAALNHARADIVANPKKFRSWLPSVLKVDSSTATRMSLPDFSAKLSVAQIQKVADLLKKLGVVTGGYDAAKYTTVTEG